MNACKKRCSIFALYVCNAYEYINFLNKLIIFITNQIQVLIKPYGTILTGLSSHRKCLTNFYYLFVKESLT